MSDNHMIGTSRWRRHPTFCGVSGLLLVLAIASCSGDDSVESGELVTTTAPVPDQLEQAGIDLRNAILADGEVTQEEFNQAVEAAAACLENHGLTGVTWNEYGDLGWAPDDGSQDRQAAEEAIHNLCYFSYLGRLTPP